ncbi:unnamed protein product [Clonostachys byssicola]|uniref:Uncharacterized protein n=1 Tax=Clonostachys byssicola TaxID=160290 RepID=A0A9N9Y0G9_9HYPO|nr:unnamed protein product [Clonostachys byssicola]
MSCYYTSILSQMPRQSLPTPPVEVAGRRVVQGVLDQVAPVLDLLGLQPQLDPLLVEAPLHGLGLHEQPAQVPAARAELLYAGGLALEQVVLQPALALDGLEDAHGQAGLDVGADGRGEEALDEDVWPPEPLGLDLVLLRDVVAELDAGGAVKAPVRLLVDLAFAVGVGRDDFVGEAGGLDRLGLEGR